MEKFKNYSLYFLATVALFTIFKLQSDRDALPYDVISESLIMGRLMESERSGIGSYSGLTGMLSDHSDDDDYERNAALQFELIKHPLKRNDYKGFTTYDSQPGGQGMFFSVMHRLSHHDLLTDISLFKDITIFTNSLTFVLFLGWCKRNFGFIPSLFVFSGIVASSWILLFSESLWWCLWAFYIPFLTMLFALEKNVSSKKLLLLVYLSIFVKCFFNGFEYISTALMAVYVPVIYYFLKQRHSFRHFMLFCVQTGLAMIFGILTQMAVLVYQISLLKGTFGAGISHIVSSYKTRTADVVVSGKITSLTDNMYLGVLLKYMSGDAFTWFPLKVQFLIPVILVFVVGILLFRTHKELVLATYFSFLAPISWYLLFIQHSNIHYHLNYIVWYIPFLLLGFLCIGIYFNSIVKKGKS